MRREPSPHHLARMAERVEVFGFVSRDAARENVRFPSDGRSLVAFELTDHVERAVDAVQSRRRKHVLPAYEEAGVINARSGFYFSRIASSREAILSATGNEATAVAHFASG